jgi:hypothetical protein
VAEGTSTFSHRNYGICWESQAKGGLCLARADQSQIVIVPAVSVLGLLRVRLTTIAVTIAVTITITITITIPVCRNEVKTVAALWIQL